MRNSLMGGTIGIALLAAQSVSAAPKLQTFNPSSPPNIDYSDDSCAFRREFSDGSKKLALELRQFAPGDTFYAIAASKSFEWGAHPLKVRFLPDEKPHEASSPSALHYPNGLTGFSWSDSFMSRDSMADKRALIGAIPDRSTREKAIQGLELSAGLLHPVIIMTGEMHLPMEALRTCMDELLTHWGIDAVAQRTLSRRAEARDQQQWAKIIQDNYPGKMLVNFVSGIVRVRVMVGPDGRPTSCHIQVPSQDLSFEKTACAGLMKASRFNPALDAGGKPIASYYVTSVFYKVN